MLSSFINKCLKKKQDGPEAATTADPEEKRDHHHRKKMLRAACSDLEACCSAPNCLGLSIVGTDSKHTAAIAAAPTTSSSRASRSNFVNATTSSVFPSTQFTDPESLPHFSHALSTFTQAYPHYNDTEEADRIRRRHYPHLSHHVCLDYAGFTLFSHSQPPPPFFTVSYSPASPHGNPGSGLESAIRNRITSFLNLTQENYAMVFTASRTSAFKLLAETYPFHSRKRLLTVYDHESEAVSAMAESAHKRGAKAMSAEFCWPGLRIHSAGLKSTLKGTKRKNKRRKGLFVFPLQSRMTGARYPYLWMRTAHDNGWDVVLDACALGPKDLDTLGLSLIHPDFVVCSFFKVLGEDPSGFAALLIKKSSCSSVSETSVMARSIGAIRIVPATDDFSGTLSEVDTTTSSFSGPFKKITSVVVGDIDLPSSSTSHPRTSSMAVKANEFEKTTAPSEIVELESNNVLVSTPRTEPDFVEIECMGLDHADSLGLLLISSRLRYITNWLVLALEKLRHPNTDQNGHHLVRIYGPRIKFDRGPAVAFNLFDWKGEKVEPALVQKLADRSNISLSCGFLCNIWFSEKYAEERDGVSERRRICPTSDKGKEEIDVGIGVVNASLGFLANFEDAYKLWSFVARFLDADFVEKERWRYLALNQKMIEV